MTKKSNYLFSFGLGYSAISLNRLLDKNQWVHNGTKRTASSSNYLFDGHSPLLNANKILNKATHILITIPPNSLYGDPVLFHHKQQLADLKHLTWIGYLSTTGVYGDTKGQKANETWPTNPTSTRSQLRHNAEQDWIKISEKYDLPLHIFRLPGIYGPGRSALDQLRSGKAKRIIKKNHQFSRIHVDDIANCLLKSMNNPKAGEIYNVCDDEPAAPELVISFAAELLRIPPPPRIQFDKAKLEMSEMALSFWSDNRTIDNSHMKQSLDLKLKHATFRDGLTAIHQLELTNLKNTTDP